LKVAVVVVVVVVVVVGSKNAGGGSSGGDWDSEDRGEGDREGEEEEDKGGELCGRVSSKIPMLRILPSLQRSDVSLVKSAGGPRAGASSTR